MLSWACWTYSSFHKHHTNRGLAVHDSAIQFHIIWCICVSPYCRGMVLTDPCIGINIGNEKLPLPIACTYHVVYAICIPISIQALLTGFEHMIRCTREYHDRAVILRSWYWNIQQGPSLWCGCITSSSWICVAHLPTLGWVATLVADCQWNSVALFQLRANSYDLEIERSRYARPKLNIDQRLSLLWCR